MPTTFDAIRLRAGDKFGSDKIVSILRSLAQDNARTKIEVAGVADMTDNSTGTAAAATVAVTLPVAFTKTGTDVSPKAGFDTALGKLGNIAAVFADHLNRVRARLGLTLVTLNDGTIAAAGTLPALDKSLVAVDGTGNGAVDAASAITQLSKARNNQATCLRSLNEVLTAIGEPTLINNTGGTPDKDTMTLESQSATAAGVDGSAASQSLSDTVTDAALLALANNWATMAAAFNNVMPQTGMTDLTDSSGGTAANAIPAFALPTAYQGAAASPKAGFDAELAKYRNNFADLTKQLNELAKRYGVDTLTDQTAGTANTTVESVLNALVGVNGAGAVDFTTATTTLTAIRNNIATVTAKINEMVEYFGEIAIDDNTGGTVNADGDVVAMADTAASVDGTAADSVSDTDMDALLVIIRNAFASMAAKLNAMTGTLTTAVATKPLRVVAAD